MWGQSLIRGRPFDLEGACPGHGGLGHLLFGVIHGRTCTGVVGSNPNWGHVWSAYLCRTILF